MTDTQNNWENRIHEWEESGLSREAFCRRENIGFSGFYYWQRKLAGNNHRFVELKQKQTHDSHPSITIVLPNDTAGKCQRGKTEEVSARDNRE